MTDPHPEPVGDASPSPTPSSSVPTAPTDQWLRAALRRARERGGDPTDELAAAVRIYTRQFRDAGATPERAVAQLKSTIEAVLEEGRPTRELRELASRVVGEAIEAYYGER